MHTRGDGLFAVLILFCGFLYCNLIKINSLGMGVTIFAVLFCTETLIYLWKGGFRQTRESLIYLAIIAVSAANFSLFDNLILKGFQFIFLSACVIYWICVTTNNRLEKKLSIYVLGDLINQVIILPFSNLTRCFEEILHLTIRNQKGKGFLKGLIGIIFMLPVLILVVNLLINADAAFEGLVNRLQFTLSDSVVTYLVQIIVGIPVACYLYGLIYGNVCEKKTGLETLESINQKAAALKFASGTAVYSGLTMLNLVFVIFFVSQLSYLFSAFGGVLPGAMTYAEYARRGFFELCAVSGINLAVIIVSHGITKREKEKVLHIETVALCLFTIMLIITALSKMGMYIGYYGLTQLRVFTTWFMVLLLVLFFIIAIRQFRVFNGTKVAAVSFLILFIALSYSNVDGMIAKYNIDRYQNGTLKNVDVEALSQLSDAAIPYLYELYQDTEDLSQKANIRMQIRDKWKERDTSYQETFRDWNLQKMKADRIREGL